MKWNEINYGMNNGARQQSGRIGVAFLFFGVGYGPPAAIMLRKEKTSPRHFVFSFLSSPSISFNFVNELIERWNGIGAAPNQTKKERNEPRELIDFFVGYGAEPICATPFPFHQFSQLIPLQPFCLIPFLCCSAIRKTSPPLACLFSFSEVCLVFGLPGCIGSLSP